MLSLSWIFCLTLSMESEGLVSRVMDIQVIYTYVQCFT
jgi:hypothetical protein